MSDYGYGEDDYSEEYFEEEGYDPSDLITVEPGKYTLDELNNILGL